MHTIKNRCMKVIEVQNILLHQHDSPFDLGRPVLGFRHKGGAGSFGGRNSSWRGSAHFWHWSDNSWPSSRQTSHAGNTMTFHGEKYGSAVDWCKAISTTGCIFDGRDWPNSSSCQRLHWRQAQICGLKHLLLQERSTENIGKLWGSWCEEWESKLAVLIGIMKYATWSLLIETYKKMKQSTCHWLIKYQEAHLFTLHLSMAFLIILESFWDSNSH